ncbi:MAG TPA: hypothetical protein VGE69_00735 [Pseudomonadales bacterium]
MSFNIKSFTRASLLAALVPAFAFAADARSDFTGIWQLASRPMTSAQGYPDVPLTPEGRALVDAHRALVDPVGENPTLWCVSHGMPEMMMGGGGYPLEIIQKDDQVTMISEWASETRRVYLGDRIRPTDDMFPSRQGYSTGHWEGDTLVVETTKLQDMVDSRFPHSSGTTIVERFRLTQDADGAKRLIADTEVRDPLWLSEPLQYRLEWAPYSPGWIQPYECMEETWIERLEELEVQAEAKP